MRDELCESPRHAGGLDYLQRMRCAGNDVALQAATRFLDAPKLERFVAANVVRSIDFLSGRTVRED